MQGKLEGLQKYDLIARKADQEKELLDWIAADPARTAKYGKVAADLNAFLERQKAFTARSEALNGVLGGSTILGGALTLVRAVEELQKPDKDRDPAFQERNLPQPAPEHLPGRAGLCLRDRPGTPEVDDQAAEGDPADTAQWPASLRTLVAGSDADVAGPGRRHVRPNQAGRSPEAARSPRPQAGPAGRRSTIPFLKLAAEMEKELKVIREDSKGFGREGADLKMAYEAAILEMKKGTYPPDANGTIRFTYGPVLGYSPKDAVRYTPMTTLKGVIEKDTGRVSLRRSGQGQRALEGARTSAATPIRRLGDVVTCFLNTTNVTGGNSGSPTLNAKGEQIGIIFDMTYESVSGTTSSSPSCSARSASTSATCCG